MNVFHFTSSINIRARRQGIQSPEEKKRVSRVDFMMLWKKTAGLYRVDCSAVMVIGRKRRVDKKT